MARTDRSPHTRALVLGRFEVNRPKPGRYYEDWVTETAADLEVSENTIRRIIAEEQSIAIQQIRAETGSRAQEIADHLGATMVKAISTLNRGMSASKRTLVRDSRGIPVRDEEGKLTYDIQPLHAERRLAAIAMLEIHGGFAPQKIDLTAKVEHHLKLSDEELLKKLDDITNEIRGGLASSSSAVSGSGSHPAGIAGPQGDSRHLVLVDGVYEDPGRAGSG